MPTAAAYRDSAALRTRNVSPKRTSVRAPTGPRYRSPAAPGRPEPPDPPEPPEAAEPTTRPGCHNIQRERTHPSEAGQDDDRDHEPGSHRATSAWKRSESSIDWSTKSRNWTVSLRLAQIATTEIVWWPSPAASTATSAGDPGPLGESKVPW